MWFTPLGRAVQLIMLLCKGINKLAQLAGGWKGIGANMLSAFNGSAEKAAAINAEIKNSRQNNAVKAASGAAANKFSAPAVKMNREEAAAIAVNGSHAAGLNYVPFDGYIAELHQGERIQTRKEADLFRSGNVFPSAGRVSAPADRVVVEYKPVINVQGSMTEREQENFMQLLRAHKDEVVRLVQSAIARQEARSY